MALTNMLPNQGNGYLMSSICGCRIARAVPSARLANDDVCQCERDAAIWGDSQSARARRRSIGRKSLRKLRVGSDAPAEDYTD